MGHGAGIYPVDAERCSKTTNLMVLAAMAVCCSAQAHQTPLGPSQRLRPRERRTHYHSIRRHTICTGCLTTASRWGRRLWPLLAGRMRLYRMGRSLSCGCSRWLLASRNTACEALWMATNGLSLSSRSNCWRPVRRTAKPTHRGGFQVGGNLAEGPAQSQNIASAAFRPTLPDCRQRHDLDVAPRGYQY